MSKAKKDGRIPSRSSDAIFKTATAVMAVDQAERFLEGEEEDPGGVEHDTARSEAIDRYAIAALTLFDLGMKYDEFCKLFDPDVYSGHWAELEAAGWQFDSAPSTAAEMFGEEE